MRRCVIIAGATINNYSYIKNCLTDNDFYICCDSGLKHIDKLNVIPNLIIGDFDSYDNPNLDIETIVLPCEKDDTDSIYAVNTAIEMGFDDFLLLGFLGGRFDHSLVNLSSLIQLHNSRKTAIAIDDFSEIELVTDSAYIEDNYSFFSLIAFGGDLSGVTIDNAKYPLINGNITMGYQYGISNEVIKGQTASVSIADGMGLLIKVRD